MADFSAWFAVCQVFPRQRNHAMIIIYYFDWMMLYPTLQTLKTCATAPTSPLNSFVPNAPLLWTKCLPVCSAWFLHSEGNTNLFCTGLALLAYCSVNRQKDPIKYNQIIWLMLRMEERELCVPFSWASLCKVLASLYKLWRSPLLEPFKCRLLERLSSIASLL